VKKQGPWRFPLSLYHWDYFSKSNIKMGGGNGLKSHMAQKKNAEKKAAEGKGGGGSAGIAERKGALNVVCAICMAPFISSKMKAQLNSHHTSKHARQSFAECFPGIDP
jgi:hypothetical protein